MFKNLFKKKPVEVHFDVEASIIKANEIKKGDIIVFRIKGGSKKELDNVMHLIEPIFEDKTKVHALFCTEKHEIEIINLIEKE